MLRVLLVGGDEPTRDLLRDGAKAEDWRVTEAATAEQMLAQVAAGDAPSVVLSEVRLAGRDGLWLAEQLQIQSPQVAVVIATAVHDFDTAVRGLQAGVVDYLVKPFTHERLAAALRRAQFAHQSRGPVVAMQRELDRRHGQVAETLAELELNALATIKAMLVVLQAREPGALDHAQRVAHLAVNLALALDVDEPQLSDIERGALLHDVGRLALPDGLLTGADTAPSAADGRRLREHPLFGRTILESVPFLADAAPFVVAVHERYDGTGFPYGLRAEEIPFGARIISVAMAYDELVSGIGHVPVTPERAREILRVTRASEFDPLVLAALKTLQPDAHRAPAVGEALVKAGLKRRWRRKRVRRELDARVAGMPARLVDVGYGGFRVELPGTFPARPAMTLTLEIPQFGMLTTAICKWTKPHGTSGSLWCGAALADEAEAGPGGRWRVLVDALPVEASIVSDDART